MAKLLAFTPIGAVLSALKFAACSRYSPSPEGGSASVKPFGRFILVDPRLVRAPVHFPVGCALPVSSLTRTKSTILASSHVRPPSLDHDSS